MGQTNLSTLKTEVKSALDSANTTTASPLDLSNGLNTRVQKVLKVNVEHLPIQPSFFPCVTMFYENKSVELLDISRNMVSGFRKATIDLKIVGLVWVDDINATDFELSDPADDECEQLMENVEEVLKNDPTFSGNALYGYPTGISYHSFVVSEGAHMRAGIMNFQIVVRY